ncbi:Ervatamin-C, putative [Perkinsus marinus ATCC 50983]|uniref:Ervatamin-C, putative n=1 Tax=Perkinsus marinus (strain ATCC 50983 / TXsc) TaxID=423536 RepID=C5KY95_PERM5|nr:Ervatamin-C, putative [Perkinsus marinus ATCC 50983]EER10547.1 Ervatamin-C, putative [Perkinsus marinus ATCC 50983]|eukprot:XP_002778752.1 Ervatamin-C, putative [Perkinsus marinus ATCC 50983]
MAQAIAGGSDRYGQLENIDQAFHDFMTRYNKKYETDEQYQVAKAAFARNVREIEELRANDSQDLIMDLPPSIDWEAAGALAPVRNQKACGACYAINAAIVMESRFKIQTKITKVVPFSVQQIVDCSGPNENNLSYPYKAKAGRCKTSITNDPKEQCLKSGDIASIPIVPAANEALMMQAVATGPVTVRLWEHARLEAKNVFVQLRSQELWSRSRKSYGNYRGLQHFLEGEFGEFKISKYWKILNTWGESWGLRGFAYIERTGNEPVTIWFYTGQSLDGLTQEGELGYNVVYRGMASEPPQRHTLLLRTSRLEDLLEQEDPSKDFIRDLRVCEIAKLFALRGCWGEIDDNEKYEELRAALGTSLIFGSPRYIDSITLEGKVVEGTEVWVDAARCNRRYARQVPVIQLRERVKKLKIDSDVLEGLLMRLEFHKKRGRPPV